MPHKSSRAVLIPLAVLAMTCAMGTPPALAKGKPTGSGGGGKPSATATSSYSTPTVVSDLDSGEPGIDVSPTDGAIYINAPSALGNVGTPSYVWKSTNQ